MAYQTMSPLETSTGEHQRTEHVQLAAAKKGPQAPAPPPLDTARQNIEEATRRLLQDPPPESPAAKTLNDAAKAIQRKPAPLPTPIPTAPAPVPGS